MPPAERAPSSSARVVYAGIVASTLIVTIGALVVSMSLKSASGSMGAPDAVVFLLGLGVFVAGTKIRQRLGERRGGRSREEWWAANAGRVLLLWGLMELAAMAGAALLFATGHLPVFVMLALAALAGLATSSPGRFAAD